MLRDVHAENLPIVICFYTIDTPYQQEVLHLGASCEKHQIEHCIEGLPSTGSWEGNCALKPVYILEKLKEARRPLLWVDADAVFVKKPDYSLFSECDFSVRINDYLDERHESKVESGTVFINYSPEGVKLVEEWAAECDRQISDPNRVMEFWDQIALRDVLSSHTEARILPLPHGYCKVFDLDDPFIADRDIVIEHRQASRRFKKLIK